MKNIVNWNYERGTWQWDLLCLLILVFIFLTPKGWFSNGEQRVATHNPPEIVQAEDCGCETE